MLISLPFKFILMTMILFYVITICYEDRKHITLKQIRNKHTLEHIILLIPSPESAQLKFNSHHNSNYSIQNKTP